jgi:hypothetical protein
VVPEGQVGQVAEQHLARGEDEGALVGRGEDREGGARQPQREGEQRDERQVDPARVEARRAARHCGPPRCAVMLEPGSRPAQSTTPSLRHNHRSRARRTQVE